MNKDYALYNLGEAQKALGQLIADMKSDPEYDYGNYVVDMAAGFLNASYQVNAKETYFHTGLSEFYVEAPHHFSLMPYRGHTVEISGRLVPKGKVPYPSLIVENIVPLREPNI